MINSKLSRTILTYFLSKINTMTLKYWLEISQGH